MKVVEHAVTPRSRRSTLLVALFAALAVVSAACTAGSTSKSTSASSAVDGSVSSVVSSTNSATVAPDGTPATATASAVRRGGDLRFGFLVGFNTMDPHRFVGSHHLTAMWSVYDGLTGIDDNNLIVPRAAESWKVSDDGLVYEFTLRKGMTFHDGAPVDGAAVVANIDRARDTTTGSSAAFGRVISVKSNNPGTVTITLSDNDPTLLANLATDALLVSPKALLGNIDATPVGSGPFKVTSWVQGGTTLKLERFADYWEPGVPQLDTLTIEVIEDVQTRASAQLAGDLDLQLVTPGTGFLIPTLTQGGLAVDSRQQGLLWYLGLRSSAKPFDDVRVREAFNRSVDRTALSEALGFGYGKPAIEYLVQQDATPSAVDPKLYSYDPKRSRELLAQAGYPDGLEITIGTIGAFATVLEALAEQVEAGGWRVKIETGDDPIAFLEAGKGAAVLNVSSELVDGLTALRGSFSADSIFAAANGKVPAITEEFEKALTATSPEKSRQSAARVSAVLAEQYYLVPLFRPGLQSVTGKKVSGFTIPLSSQSQFRSVSVTK